MLQLWNVYIITYVMNKLMNSSYGDRPSEAATRGVLWKMCSYSRESTFARVVF